MIVNGPTSASVPITIDNVAAVGQRNVTITTGAEVATTSFTVIAGVPAVTVINPNTIQPSQTESGTITGVFTNWVSGTTKANFGPGISVGGAAAGTFGPVTVNSATSLTASLVTSGATTGFRTVQIQTGSQTLTVVNGIDVETCTTTAPTMLYISPADAASNVPLNTVVAAVMSNPIDPTSITNSSITVTPSGGSAIAGTVTLASDGVTLTFAPAAALTASKVYNVSVGGFNDVQSNPVATFTSSFTTGTSAFGSRSFTISSMSPTNGATGVSVTSPVTFTMSNLINPASVNNGTVLVYDSVIGVYVTGSFTVSGNTVTFTPLTQYPANTLMYMGVSSLADEAGNTDSQYWYTFTTANSANHTAPTATITSSNGSTNLGLNTQAVLTFSKSINASTITTNSLALFNGDTPVSYGYSISRDNRTLILNPYGSAWASGATITIELTNGIEDLSGNALANTTSQFTLTTALSGTAHSVPVERKWCGSFPKRKVCGLGHHSRNIVEN